MSRRIKLIFTLSLLLNLVLIGVAGGMYSRHSQERPRPMAEDLSPAGQALADEAFRNGRREAQTLIDEVKAQRRIVETVAGAETFDEKAYDRAVADVLDTQASLQRRKAETVKNLLTRLSPDDRRAFGAHITRMFDGRRGPKPPHGPGADHPPAPEPGMEPPRP